MSDRKGKQPVRSHRPSQLRNEIIPDSSDNERGINESVVQVPNSDTAVPETQYIPEGLEHDRRDIWRQSSEPPNTADEALLSRCGYSKKTGTTVASPLVVRQLEKPKEVQGSIFSFASPNAFSKPALQMPLMPRPREDATVAPKPSPSVVQSTTPQNVDGNQAGEPKNFDQFPELSVVHFNDPAHQGSQTVQRSFGPLERDRNATSDVDVASATSRQTARDIIAEQRPAQIDHPIKGSRPERRSKGKKPKKGKRPKPPGLDAPATATVATAAWPPSFQHNAPHGPISKHPHTTTRDGIYPGFQENKASIPTHEYAVVKESLQSHHPEAAPIASHDALNDHQTSQAQNSSTTMLPVGGMEGAPGLIALRPTNETMSRAPQNSPYTHVVSPRHEGNTEHGSGHHDTRCTTRPQTVACTYLEPENSPVIHETYEHESVQPQPKSHNYGDNTEATSKPHESHCPAGYIQDFSQSEASAAHASTPPSDAQTNVFDVHPGSDHLSQSRQVHVSMLHEKTGQDSSNRISKMRTKKRTKGPTAPPDLRNLNHGTTLSTSPEHEVILNMMAMCLRAGDTKARNILDTNAKAHEDTVTSLRETIGQQNNLIQNLQARNDSLEGRVQKVSDSTIRLQKYVKGMEGDYARLRIQAEAHRKTCDNLVRLSIDEAEQEKSALKHDFLKTVDALNTSQRHMRAAMNDCFNQLMSTEGRYHAVSKQMQKLTTDYNEEKMKSSNLEQQILPAVQAIRASLGENRTVILEKLGDVQGSLDDKSAEQERDVRLKDCLDALHSLQAIPMLTISDVRKAEVMLRFIHENASLKMSNISRSVENIQIPSEDIRAYLRDQLSTLREDILRYEDVSEECRKTQQLKEHFLQQFEMQKEQCAKLEEAMRISRQQEADVKARCSFLESELETWKGKSFEHDSESAQTEQEAERLRKQLEKAREDLREELTEIGRVQQRLEIQAEDLSTIKATLGEKETLYQGCINKLAHERDGKDVLLRESQIEKDKLADDLSHAESKIRELASEAEQVRDANTQMRKDLQKAQSAAAEASALALELADLERQMMVKSAESRRATDEATSLSSQLASLEQLMAQASESNHSKEDDLKNTKVELERLVKGAADHAREKDHLKARLNEHVSTITGLKEKIDAAHRAQEKSVASLKQLQNSTVVMQKEKDQLQKEKDQLTLQMSVEQFKLKTLKQELDARDATHRKDVDKLDSLQRRLETLQEEKEELKSKMERSRANESKLVEAQAEYLSEKEDLQLELAKLQASLESKDIELRRTRADSIERSKTVEENRVAESEELKRRIGQIEIALKEAEKTAEHKSRELEAHKKATMEKYDLLVQEARNQQNTRHESHRISGSEMLLRDPRLQESTSMHAVGSQQRAPSSSEASAFSEEPLEGTVTKGRKKPNRLNLTVLNVSDASRTQSTQLLRQTNAVNDRHRHQDEGIARTGCVHAAATNELGAREMLDENGVSSTYPAGEEPQEPQRTLVYTAGAFDESMKAMNRPGTADTSSSVLSDPLSSDDLIDMDPLEQGTAPISPNNGYEQFQDEEVPRSDRYDETPQRSSRHSLHHVASFSRDRPKSQANTGSRMLPPATPSAPSTKNYGSPANARHRFPKKSARSVGGAPSGNTRSSSPDYVHRPVSSHKTYGNYNPSGDSPGAPYETHRPSVNRSTTKRKAPGGGALVVVQSKRHRASAHESSLQSTPSSQPAQISQAQSQDPRVVPTPRARRLKGGKRNDEFDAMFDRELQTGPSRRPH